MGDYNKRSVFSFLPISVEPRKPLNHRVIGIKNRRRIRGAHGGTLPKKYRRKK